MSDVYEAVYNPDVLECIANLSNDEVFTPPEVANAMLDLLPQELFSDPNTKFLDPACKSGVFLREIAKRLLTGLEDKIPDLQERVDHIFKNQIYGIAITELTSLLSRRSVYCCKYADNKYSVTKFNDLQGNIFFSEAKHLWINGKCLHCGIGQQSFEEQFADKEEKHAYQFIHNAIPGDLENMKFDVIIGNPPYQLDDGGNGKSAKPIYHHFIEQAKKLNPHYLSMIIPSRWFSGGKGLEQFRKGMLEDKHISHLVDFENFKDVFPGVDLAGGACYFLRNREYSGDCIVRNYNDHHYSEMNRKLDEYDFFVRQNKAIEIIRKIKSKNTDFKTLDDRISSRKPFGLPTNYEPKNEGIPCWFIQRIGLKYASEKDVDDSSNYLNKWKYIVPKSPIAGQTDFSKPVAFYYDGNTKIAKPGECCTESFIVLGAFDTEEEVKSFKSYILTKTVRFLLLQTVVSQDVTKKNYCFVPDINNYTRIFDDDYLCKLWGITQEEWNYIDSRICNIER